MRAMIFALCLLVSVTAFAADKASLPDGVQRIAKWEASKIRVSHGDAVSLGSDKDVRRQVAGMPKDGATYVVQASGAGYCVQRIDADGAMVGYCYRWPYGPGLNFTRVDFE